MHSKLKFGTAVSALALVAAIGFTATRHFMPVQPAESEPVRQPWWYVDVQKADDQHPRLDATIADIRLGPSVDMTNKLVNCPTGYEQAAPGYVVPTETSAAPEYLPSTAESTSSGAVLCNGQVVAAEADYSILGDRATGRLGGRLQIYRFRGERLFQIDVPQDRTRQGTVAGRAAVIVSPVTEDGWGLSAIFVYEPWGLTTLRVYGMTEQELVRVAESLYSK